MGSGRRFLASAAAAMLLSPGQLLAAAADAPSVQVKLSVTEAGPGQPWQLKLENTSSAPVRVVDDARLLWFDVTIPGQKPKTCRLPDDVFPKSADAPPNELVPGGTITHDIDPRFYCFSPGRQEILVPSAQITPHYGWANAPKHGWSKHAADPATKPPFVAEPGRTSTATPVKDLVADTLVLDTRYAPWSADLASDTADPDDDDPAIEMVRGSDASTEPSVTATVRVRNPTASRVTVFVRRELLTFEVMSPSGTVNCVSEPDQRNPDRRAFTTLGPHGSMTIVSRLVELCARGTFSKAGLYVVHARLDAEADGSDFGLDAFVGSLHTLRPTTVRVRHTIHLTPNRTMAAGASGGGGAGQPANPVFQPNLAPAAAPVMPPPTVPPPPPPSPPPDSPPPS
jgi:hypothetical protein